MPVDRDKDSRKGKAVAHHRPYPSNGHGEDEDNAGASGEPKTPKQKMKMPGAFKTPSDVPPSLLDHLPEYKTLPSMFNLSHATMPGYLNPSSDVPARSILEECSRLLPPLELIGQGTSSETEETPSVFNPSDTYHTVRTHHEPDRAFPTPNMSNAEGLYPSLEGPNLTDAVSFWGSFPGSLVTV